MSGITEGPVGLLPQSGKRTRRYRENQAAKEMLGGGKNMANTRQTEKLIEGWRDNDSDDITGLPIPQRIIRDRRHDGQRMKNKRRRRAATVSCPSMASTRSVRRIAAFLVILLVATHVEQVPTTEALDLKFVGDDFFAVDWSDYLTGQPRATGPTKSPAPTESPAPSPSPSSQPSESPTRITLRPTDTFAPSPSPSFDPTIATSPPSPIPTSPPTFRLTSSPTKAPTQPPSMSPTPGPSGMPTPLPTAPPTRTPSASPTLPPTGLPTTGPTPLPTTGVPTPFPTNEPTPFPVFKPTLEPTTEPPTSSPSDSPSPTQGPTETPTMSPSTSISPTESSRPSMTPSSTPSKPPTTLNGLSNGNMEPTPPSLDEIPLDPFSVTLSFNETMDQIQINKIALELGLAINDYLTEGLREVDFGEGVELRDLFLIITAPLASTERTRLLRRRLQRQGEEEILLYDVSGRADFDAVNESAINTLIIKEQLDVSVGQMLEGDENQQAFQEFLKARQETELLRTINGATIETGNTDSENERPGIIAIVIGFALVGLMVIGLLFYANIWRKHRKQRAQQRKRDRQGIVALGPRKPVRQSRPIKLEQQLPPVQSSASEAMPRIPTHSTKHWGESSDDDSDYDGVESAANHSSESSTDPFAKELKLAADLDMRAWEDYQKQREELASSDVNVGKSPKIPAFPMSNTPMRKELALYEGMGESEGMEVVDNKSQVIIQPTSPAKSPRRPPVTTPPPLTPSLSFPYGDESARRTVPSSPDPPAMKGASLASRSDPQGTRGSQMYTYVPNDGESTKEIDPSEVGLVVNGYAASRAIGSPTRNERAREAAIQRRRDRQGQFQERRWSTMDTVGSNATESFADSDNAAMELMHALMGDTDSPGRRPRQESPRKVASPARSFGEDALAEAAMASRSLENLRASPVSVPSSQAIGSLPTNEEANRTISTSKTDTSARTSSSPRRDDDTDQNTSLMSLDVVAEVAKLAKFVKKYERKKERKAERQKAKEAAVGTSRDSVSYEAMSDSISAIHASNRTPTAAYSLRRVQNGEEESDFTETDESSADSLLLMDDEDPSTSTKYGVTRGMISGLLTSIDGETDGTSDDENNEDSDGSRLGISPFSVDELLDKHGAQDKFSSQPETVKAMAAGSAPPLTRSQPPVTNRGTIGRGLSPIPATPEEESSPEGKGRRLSLVGDGNVSDSRISSDEENRSPREQWKKNKSMVKNRPTSTPDGRKTPPFQPANDSFSKSNRKGVSSSQKRDNGGERKTLASLRMREAIIDETVSDVGSGTQGALGITPTSTRDPNKSLRSQASAPSLDEGRWSGGKSKSTRPTSRIPMPRMKARESSNAKAKANVKTSSETARNARKTPTKQESRIPSPRVATASTKPTTTRSPVKSASKIPAPRSRARASSSNESAKEAKSTPLKDPGSPGTPRRSSNKGFNNIMTMFENKPKAPIFPKNENWQYMN